MKKSDLYVQRFTAYFECLGSQVFATAMASMPFPDRAAAEAVVMAMPETEVLAACSFHGDIGQPKKTLDGHAKKEQEACGEDAVVLTQLRELGAQYKAKHGIKFMMSAKGKTGQEMLGVLQTRLNNTREAEWITARQALIEIAWKRVVVTPLLMPYVDCVPASLAKHGINAAQVTISTPDGPAQTVAGGAAHTKTIFEMASLSKSVGSAFAIEYFKKHGIALSTPVNALLRELKAGFLLQSEEGKPTEWAEHVQLIHLMRHNALNLHYVKGIPANKPMPPVDKIVEGLPEYGLDAVRVINEPGKHFKYSGAGFIMLQYVIELHAKQNIYDLTRPFLDALGMQDFTFQQADVPGYEYAEGKTDDGKTVEGGRLMFAAFAAGAMSTTTCMQRFLEHLGTAYNNVDGSSVISNDTAHLMLHDEDSRSLECLNFMGCKMGTGIFVLEGTRNKFALHQGANDGFRVICIHCYAGPDCGKGVTVVCTADQKGVLFNAEMCQRVFNALRIQGVDASKYQTGFSSEGLTQENIVNKGYKALFLQAIEPARAEEIVRKGPIDPLSKYNFLVGATVVSCTNDRFARCENLISPNIPVFEPQWFGLQGKVMDSWETVRHNPLPHDELVLEVSKPHGIKFVTLSTKWHDGNQSPAIRLFGQEEGSEEWIEIVPLSKLNAHALKKIALDASHATKRYVRFNVHNVPDGGFSRLGLYEDLPADMTEGFLPIDQATAIRYPDPIPQTVKPLTIPYDGAAADVAQNKARMTPGTLVDVCSMGFGGKCVRASNEHYSPAAQVVSPYPPLHMFDGLESARSRIPGSYEDAELRLAWPTALHSIVIDFTYFVNNNPLELEIVGAKEDGTPVVVVPRQKVKQFKGSMMKVTDMPKDVVVSLTVKCFPCGGLNRLHAYAVAP